MDLHLSNMVDMHYGNTVVNVASRDRYVGGKLFDLRLGVGYKVLIVTFGICLFIR